MLLALTTTRCGKCGPIKKFLHETALEHSVTILDENHPDFGVNCKRYDATEAPTVILIEEAGEAWRVHTLEDLKEKLK